MSGPDLERLNTQASLLELDPSPVEETHNDTTAAEDGELAKREWEPQAPPHPLFSRASTLGLGSHGPAFYLSRIQKYSSITFTLFAALHVTNTALIPLVTRSVHASEPYLLLTRPYYQSIPFEPLLITTPLALHISSGIALRLFRRRQQVHRYGAESLSERRRIAWPRISGTSALGYVLVPLVAVHTFLNRVLPLMYEGGSANVGLEYVSHLCARAPFVSFMGLGLLVGVGVWHGVWGWSKWMGWNLEGVRKVGEEGRRMRKRRVWLLNGVAAAIAGVWMVGGLGVVGMAGPAEGWLGKEYDGLLQRVPLLAKWF